MEEKPYTGISGEIVFTYSFQNMFMNMTVEYCKKNIVVNTGRALILNRLVNATYNPISHVAVGTGTAQPTLADTALGSERTRKAATVTVTATSPTFNVKFSTSYTSTEINGCTEIGLFNASSGGQMITRTRFDAISIPDGTMNIDYYLNLNTGKTETVWTKTGGYTYTYQSSQPVSIMGVLETDTGNGYAKKTSISNVDGAAGSYYYDSANKILYIRCSDSADPAGHSILVLTSN